MLIRNVWPSGLSSTRVRGCGSGYTSRVPPYRSALVRLHQPSPPYRSAESHPTGQPSPPYRSALVLPSSRHAPRSLDNEHGTYVQQRLSVARPAADPAHCQPSTSTPPAQCQRSTTSRWASPGGSVVFDQLRGILVAMQGWGVTDADTNPAAAHCYTAVGTYYLHSNATLLIVKTAVEWADVPAHTWDTSMLRMHASIPELPYSSVAYVHSRLSPQEG